MLYESERTFWKDQCSVSSSMLEHVVWLRLMLTDLALPNTAASLLSFGRRLDGAAKDSSRLDATTATGAGGAAAADNTGGSSTVRTTESGGATSSFMAPGSSRPSVYDEGDVHLRLLETKLASYSIAYEQLLLMVLRYSLRVQLDS